MSSLPQADILGRHIMNGIHKTTCAFDTDNTIAIFRNRTHLDYANTDATGNADAYSPCDAWGITQPLLCFTMMR